MRRDNLTAKDPDVEAAQAELEKISSEKNNLQAEITHLADTKKRLIDEFEQGKRRMDEGLSAKRIEIETEISTLRTSCDSLRVGNKDLEESKSKLTENNAALLSENTLLNEANAKKRAERNILEKEIRDGQSTLLSLDKKCHDLDESLTSLEKTRIDLASRISALEETNKKLKKEADNLLLERADHRSSLKASVDEKVLSEAALAESKKNIENDRAELVRLQAEIFKAQGDLASYKAEKQEEENKIHEKMGNLARLEASVEAKLELFKAAKEHFTSEELLKMGIRN